MSQSKHELLIKYAWAFIGKPYIWGGDNPMKGFDCSGFIIELLRSIGILPISGDWTAQGLWNKFQDRYSTEYPGKSTVVFYGKSKDRITHVMLCLDEQYCIGAAGGDSRVNTEADAIRYNAYVKVLPIKYRKDVVSYLDFGV